MSAPLDDSLKDQLRRLAAGEFDAQELHAAVERLVAAHRDSEAEMRDWLRTLDGQGSVATIGAGGPAAAPPPTQIGPYRVLAVLGEGGMGTVYRAAQDAPVRREVALKLIKLGMDSCAVVRRFEHERQSLALMQHDGIAKVYDCGTNERGQPFFVMELVAGEPLTDYCERRRLPLADRIRLVQEACAAVQHAHHKAVVHRDLKPSNVLVCEHDGRPRVKIIDFGLAKAISAGGDGGSLLTQVGQIVGTPGYMAPEQARGSSDVDTRADVYSLGVILYELLVGELPFAPEQLHGGNLDELRRTLRDATPARPSVRLRSSRHGGAEIAARRGTSTSALLRVLKGDLDWIVLRAIDKDRERRYASPDALRADLQRYLDREPLVAGPPSVAYRLRKFAQKHRAALATGTAIAATALAGIAYAAAASGRSAVLAAENGRIRAERRFRTAILAEWLDAGPGGRKVSDAGKRQVIDELEELLAIAPDFERARWFRFALLTELDDPRAQPEEQRLAGHPVDAGLQQFFEARAAAHRRQPAKALPILAELENEPLLGAGAMILAAIMLTTCGNAEYDRALVKLWQAEALVPRHPLVLYNLAAALLTSGNGRAGLASTRAQWLELTPRLDRALTERPADSRLQLARGWAALQMEPNGFRTARSYFERAIELAPQAIGGYLNAGYTWRDEAAAAQAAGDAAGMATALAHAKAVLLRGRAADPTDFQTEITLTNVLFCLHEDDDARTAALRAIELGGEGVRAQVDYALK